MAANVAKRELFLDAILLGRNIREAARHAGIGVRTAYRWLKADWYQPAYRARRQTLDDQVMEECRALYRRRAEVVSDILDGEYPAQAKLRALEFLRECIGEEPPDNDVASKIEELLYGRGESE